MFLRVSVDQWFYFWSVYLEVRLFWQSANPSISHLSYFLLILDCASPYNNYCWYVYVLINFSPWSRRTLLVLPYVKRRAAVRPRQPASISSALVLLAAWYLPREQQRPRARQQRPRARTLQRALARPRPARRPRIKLLNWKGAPRPQPRPCIPWAAAAPASVEDAEAVPVFHQPQIRTVVGF